MELPLRAAIRELLQHLPSVPGTRWPHGIREIEVVSGAHLSVALLAPEAADSPDAHPRDELHVVVRGSGRFECGSQRTAFRPGDVLFAPAGTPHRFVDFDSNLVAWVVRWDPERPAPGPKLAVPDAHTQRDERPRLATRLSGVPRLA